MENATQILNTSSLIQPSQSDFFAELYSDTWLKQFTIVIFFFGSAFGLIFELGIIWYERNGDHNYRTVVNQLFSTTSWMVVFWILLVYIPQGVRYLAGPLNATYCAIHIFLNTFFVSCMVLMVDCIIFVRCIFIFKFSSFAVANDNLIASFLQVTTMSISFWVAITRHMNFDKMPLQYFMCSGNNPGEQKGSASSEPTATNTFNYIILGPTLLLHIFVLFCITKIFLYQRTTEQRSKSIELGRLDTTQNDNERRQVAWNDNTHQRVSNLRKSMIDLTSHTLCLIFPLIYAIVVMVVSRKDPDEFNQYQNRWFAYFTQIIGSALAMLGILVSYYAKNTSVAHAIWQKITKKN
jgi:hypothetical protein